MAFVEDLDVFFETDDFAVEAVITLSDASTRGVNVIFETPSQAVDIYDSAVVDDMPMLRIKTINLENVRRGDQIEVESKNYIIERMIDDGTGVSSVYLKY